MHLRDSWPTLFRELPLGIACSRENKHQAPKAQNIGEARVLCPYTLRHSPLQKKTAVGKRATERVQKPTGPGARQKTTQWRLSICCCKKEHRTNSEAKRN